MGVDRTDYIIYGYKLPAELKDINGVEIDIWDDKYLPYVEGHEGEKMVMIIDGMSGEYIAFGELIQKAEYNGFDFAEINTGELSSFEVKSKYDELFNAPYIGEPKLLIFTHWH